MLSALFALVLAACGGGGQTQPSGPSTGGQTLTIGGTEFKFQPPTLTAKAGTITFTFTNKGAIAHSFRIRGQSGGIETLDPGKTATATFKLKAGTYAYYCDIPGHEDAGMKGTLTVSP